ncbi:hypothetical protein J2B92_17310 [Lysinibacillus sphaericus]|uniref:hypothetical protein n=1 Tax=Lysinibacillus sphaericus TaxID=1421 RepID=UPI0018CF94D2|nr:hypothetical protein [Lysinibacillus sphaericus]MBG9756379.1 hypothetical protein [Lysinibacillus sphaericus]QTB12600.1 hypothetical protein J2B92_17310 [Lysinibacillus sphaericus]
MNAKEITVGYTYTKNLGNFENVKVDAAVTISVEPGQNEDELYSKAFESMKKQVENGLNKFTEAR